ncbi:HEAT repeat domain-containing protein [Candidatus Omnitrophota bacterium]
MHLQPGALYILIPIAGNSLPGDYYHLRQIRNRAVEAFTALGPEAIEATGVFTYALQSKDPASRQMGIKALSDMGGVDKASIPVLIGCLRDRNPMVQAEAINTLVSLGSAVEPYVTEALKSKNARMREGAIAVLKQLNLLARAHETVTLYAIPLLEDENAVVRQRASCNCDVQ